MKETDEEGKKIKEALIKRAKGYEYEEIEVTATKDGKPLKVKRTTRHVPPDVNAIKYYYCNKNKL